MQSFQYKLLSNVLLLKKELELKDMLGEMDVHNQRRTLGSQTPKIQNKATQNNLSANSCNLSAMYTNANNLTNKTNELLNMISADDLDILCITKTLLKHTHYL